MPKPEAAARETIDELLTAAGWVVCGVAEANITGHRGVATREFQLKKGHGFADYMLYVDAKDSYDPNQFDRDDVVRIGQSHICS